MIIISFLIRWCHELENPTASKREKPSRTAELETISNSLILDDGWLSTHLLVDVAFSTVFDFHFFYVLDRELLTSNAWPHSAEMINHEVSDTITKLHILLRNWPYCSHLIIIRRRSGIPVNEEGHPTEKFKKLYRMFQSFLASLENSWNLKLYSVMVASMAESATFGECGNRDRGPQYLLFEFLSMIDSPTFGWTYCSFAHELCPNSRPRLRGRYLGLLVGNNSKRICR